MNSRELKTYSPSPVNKRLGFIHWGENNLKFLIQLYPVIPTSVVKTRTVQVYMKNCQGSFIHRIKVLLFFKSRDCTCFESTFQGPIAKIINIFWFFFFFLNYKKFLINFNLEPKTIRQNPTIWMKQFTSIFCQIE